MLIIDKLNVYVYDWIPQTGAIPTWPCSMNITTIIKPVLPYLLMDCLLSR